MLNLERVALAIYVRHIKWQDRMATAMFRRLLGRVGSGVKVAHPLHLRNPRYVTVGDRFWAGPGLRIEAFDQFLGRPYAPEILIGNDVVMNFHVHIGAVSRLVIEDDVLIGSHVLITDHSHGFRTHRGVSPPVRELPLFSKGPVVIGRNSWIGEGACILAGVRIGRNAIVGCNAVVTRDVSEGSVVGGAPARPLEGSRSKSDAL